MRATGAEGIRIHAFLARAGLTSRREAERALAEGRITCNGEVVRRPGTRIDPARDAIRLDGRRVRGMPRRVYLLLNKPEGIVTTARDPQGRPVVLDLVPRSAPRVYPVGRLDVNTSGLLLLTNDGDLAAKLLRPDNHCPRVYEVKVRGLPGEAALRRLAAGVPLDGRRTRPCRIIPMKKARAAAGTGRGGRNTWLRVTLYEGRRNQIKRMFLMIGHPVSRLRRVAIGPVRDRGLRPGQSRPLTPEEVRRLREAVA